MDFGLEALILRNSVSPKTGRCKVKCSGREPEVRYEVTVRKSQEEQFMNVTAQWSRPYM